MWQAMSDMVGGDQWLSIWIWGFVAFGLISGVVTGFFRARKIQPKGFKLLTFRNEIIFGIVNVTVSAFTLGPLRVWLEANGWIVANHAEAAWWVIALEYALYFILFDTWFYWLHRWMHNEPFYRWIHKLHHLSTSPNVATTLSVNPIESLINGGFVPIYLMLFAVHDASVALIVPTNIIMGLYVHSGYEFFPRWWNKSWATKWFITATFHDQHHKYFTANFGGYTTVWDRICGTMRPKFEADFDKIKVRTAEAKRADTAEA